MLDFKFTDVQRQWIDTLKTTELPQTRGRLHNDDGYCCLGVALEVVLGVAPALIRDDDDGVRCYEDPNTTPKFRTSVLPFGAVKLLGLRSNCGKSKNQETYLSLTSLNDQGFTFKQIAEVIEANPEHVFTNGDEP